MTVPENEDQKMDKLEQRLTDPPAGVTGLSLEQVRGDVDDPHDTTGSDEDGAPEEAKRE